MHRRLLPGEKWHWYWNDVALPIGAALGVAKLAALCFPTNLSKLGTFVVLVTVGVTSFMAALMTLPLVRQRLGFTSGSSTIA
jgi:hypothetical protein